MKVARGLLIFLFGCFLSGAIGDVHVFADSGETLPSCENDVAYQQMELLTEVLMMIRRYYVEERSFDDLIQGALKGLLTSLDPYSSFMGEDEYKDLLDDTKGQYGGIGIQVGMRDGVLTIIAPIEDTPGFRAGLQSGDKIIKIDGERTSGWTLREAVRQLRGPKGQSVTLSILRRGNVEPLSIEIVRDTIEVASVKGTRLFDDRIGYVRLTQFAEPTARLLEQAIHDLQAQGMKALILDVRSNPGGLLNQAVRVAELFLQPEKIVVTTRGRDEDQHEIVHASERSSPIMEGPLVILVNGGSASASEILAGAIQDHRRGLILGEPSFGKGSVQSVIRNQSDGASAIRLTTAFYYTPTGRRIHEMGVEPDITVTVDRDEWIDVLQRRRHLESPDSYSSEEMAEFENVEDRQLQRALDLLHALLILEERVSR